MKIVWLDNWYPEAYVAANTRSYEELHQFSHGTSNFWDIALGEAGHESVTLLENVESDIVKKAVYLQPDVICSQNVGNWFPSLIRAYGFKGKLVGFCSYAASGENLLGWDALFTSFQWLADAMQDNGQNAVHLPLAFGRQVLERFPVPPVRDLPVTFVGGLGHRIWHQGTEIMAAVARHIPERFKWWGYKVGQLPMELEATYQGTAWGPAYWDILLRSKIVINRHGEIARGEPRQNMREYEAPGCGAFILSDTTKSWHSGAHYESADELLDMIPTLLSRWDGTVSRIAREGQELILNQDCYEHRVPRFLEVIESI